MKFLDVFNKIDKGNYALTDEAVYHSIQNNDHMIPLYGGNKEHTKSEKWISISAKTKKGVPITVFSGEGIIISLDGSAGSMTYKQNEEFALNHHAGFITLRDDAKYVVDLEYFSIFFQNFYRSLSVSDGSKTLSLEQIYSEEIDIPPYEVQLRIINKLNVTNSKIMHLTILKDKYIQLMKKELVFDYSEYQAKEVPVTDFLGYMSGTSELTEEKNYIRLKNSGELYYLLTGATSINATTVILSTEDKINRFEDKEGLLVIRKGNAGATRYLNPGKYVINDDAYILFLKEESRYQIHLKWFSLQYKEAFINFASSSDNGTWNMTGFFKYTKIDIPSFEEQKSIIKMYESVEKRIEAIQNIELQYNNLTTKEILIA